MLEPIARPPSVPSAAVAMEPETVYSTPATVTEAGASLFGEAFS